jgi:hypothetical protein
LCASTSGTMQRANMASPIIVVVVSIFYEFS